MPIDAVVADANVLLSAVLGKAALRVITRHGVAVHAQRELERPGESQGVGVLRIARSRSRSRASGRQLLRVLEG